LGQFIQSHSPQETPQRGFPLFIADRPAGCVFNPRCRFRTERCRSEAPLLAGKNGTAVRCHYPLFSGQPRNHPGMAAVKVAAS